ncbi:serpentine type 7TM GPCR chemoreceptor srsx domain-containing protein [Ditylenchus destructor]|nr:serpentine type 7TM GPCR chemoreceptor srsx domain-containing protein [Ditylenchus destructor]
MCWTYSLVIVYAVFQADFDSFYQNTTVGCQVTDLYRDEVGNMIARNNIILNLTTVACYVGVWILIKVTKREVPSRCFKSLTAIMLSVTFGWFLFSISNIIIYFFALTTTIQCDQYKRAFREQFDRIAVMFRLNKNHVIPIFQRNNSAIDRRVNINENVEMTSAMDTSPK